MPGHKAGYSANPMDMLKKVAVAGGTTVAGVYVLKNYIGMEGLPSEATTRAAVSLGAVSGFGCLLGDMFVAPALAGYGL